MLFPFPWLRRVLPFWRSAEIRAAGYLRGEGFKVVASGFRTKEGEVDLVAWDGDILVFVEVKSRRNADDFPEGAVGYRKQRRIVHAARTYISRHKLQAVTYRFDIVAVNDVPGQNTRCRLLRDAFRPSN